MTARSTEHTSFTLERTYDAAPARVFHAFADSGTKQSWFNGDHSWTRQAYELDFRVGGREYSSVGAADGPAHIFDARYEDIVPDQRIVFAYHMRIDETPISVSLATVELEPVGTGTHLIFTEQVVFLDGYGDDGSREEGTRYLLESLGQALLAPERV